MVYREWFWWLQCLREELCNAPQLETLDLKTKGLQRSPEKFGKLVITKRIVNTSRVEMVTFSGLNTTSSTSSLHNPNHKSSYWGKKERIKQYVNSNWPGLLDEQQPLRSKKEASMVYYLMHHKKSPLPSHSQPQRPHH